MNLHHLLTSLLLVHACKAGATFRVATTVVTTFEELGLISTASAEGFSGSLLGSGAAAAFGVGASEVFFYDAVIINGALYSVSNAVAAGSIALGAAGGIGDVVYNAITNKKASQQLVASISKASLSAASASSVASVASVSSVSVASVSSASESWASATEYLTRVESEALASNAALQSAAETYENTASDPFPDIKNTNSKRSDQPVATARASVDLDHSWGDRLAAAKRSDPVTATGVLPPPPGTAYSTVPPEARRTPEIPAGVPEYNFRMCQYDLIRMNQSGMSLLIDQPVSQSILVSNIPSTCMVLANWLMASDNPELGPHPVVKGADRLQWNGIDPQMVDLIRIGLGVAPVNETSELGEAWKSAKANGLI